MIDVIAYSAGSIKNPVLHNLNLVRSTAWIDVTDPKIHELELIKKKFNIPLTELRHALDVKETPRIKITSDYTLIIFGARVVKDDYPSAPLAIFMTKRYIITIHVDKINALENIDPKTDIFKKIMQRGIPFLLYTLLFRTIKDYTEPMEKIEDSVESIEDEVISRYSKKSTGKISDIKTQLAYIKKSLVGNQRVISSLTKEPVVKNSYMFEDLNVELTQLVEETNVYIERLNTSLTIYLTVISNRVNEVMKYFTIIASLLLVPMLITGLYGMNVTLPIQQHHNAFWVMILFIIVSILSMLTVYRIKKWV